MTDRFQSMSSQGHVSEIQPSCPNPRSNTLNLNENLLSDMNPNAKETRTRMLPAIIKLSKTDLRSLS